MIRFILCAVRRPDQRPEDFRRELDASQLMNVLERIRVHTGAVKLVRSFRLDTDFTSALELTRQAEGNCDAILELQWPEGTPPNVSLDDPVLADLMLELRGITPAIIDRSRSFSMFCRH